MYPYSYGDNGGSFELNRIDKILLFSLSMMIAPLIFVPLSASASNETEIALHKCMSYVQDTDLILARCLSSMRDICREEHKMAQCSINPIMGVLCLTSGVCLEKARTNFISGRIGTGVSWSCGALSVICVQQICVRTSFGL